MRKRTCRSTGPRSKASSRKRRGLDASERSALFVAAEYVLGQNWSFRIVERKIPRSPYLAVLEIRWTGLGDLARRVAAKSGTARRGATSAGRKWR